MTPIFRSRDKYNSRGWYVGETGPFDSEGAAWRHIREDPDDLYYFDPATGIPTYSRAT